MLDGMTGASHQPHKKARTQRKAKTGCGTCKARRVKCDEGKPVCSRCRSTGRVCDGYGVWGGGGNGYAERYGLVKQAPSSVTIGRSLTQSMGMEELRYLQLFRLRFIHTLSGWFGSRFWAGTVLPATSTEPAILHAVIALSVAHRCEFQEWQAPDTRERFMLVQYSKAIHLLQSSLRHRDSASITIVLIICQIFTLLECLRGRYKMAGTHLRNGLRLLKDTHTGDSSSHSGLLVLKSSSQAKTIDKSIFQKFATLHVQTDLFNRHLADVNLLLQPQETEMPFPTFSNAEEAKACLDTLLHSILLIAQRLQGTKTESGGYSPAVIRAQEQVVTLLATWYKTYLRTASDFGHRAFGIRTLSDLQAPQEVFGFGSRPLPNGLNAREPLAYRLLLNYHTMATIMCNMCLRAQSESSYEAHSTDFASILRGSVEIWKVYSLAREIPGNVELSNSISDFGFITPLYYTALKCRNHRIRLHAIRLLGQIQYKEVVWDSLLAASIARKVMELEEHGSDLGLAVRDDFPLDEIPNMDECHLLTLPESSLFHDVQVNKPDDSASRLFITCKRWRTDGSLDIVRCRLEGERWFETKNVW